MPFPLKLGIFRVIIPTRFLIILIPTNDNLRLLPLAMGIFARKKRVRLNIYYLKHFFQFRINYSHFWLISNYSSLFIRRML